MSNSCLHTTAYTYDPNDNLLTVTDSQGTITRTYDSLKRVTSYTNANNQTIGYEYDAFGNLKKLTYPDNKQVSYTYNANNQMTKVKDWNNKAIYTNNENTETPFGNMTLDYGWTFKNIDGIFTLTTPEGIDHKFAPNLVPEQSTSSVNDMLINGFTPISNEATQYSITKTQEGYLVTSNQLDKYGFDENGALTSIEDKTGYKIDISRTVANITKEYKR